jgi:hypothetical protein
MPRIEHLRNKNQPLRKAAMRRRRYGIVPVSLRQVNPSCTSSDRRRRHPAPAAAAKITASQTESW